MYVVNLLNSRWKFQPVSGTDQVFLINKKDYASSPSKRVRIMHGLTFVDSGMQTMGIHSRNEVVRLKNGNFLIKFDYQQLKIYWNITKEII